MLAETTNIYSHGYEVSKHSYIFRSKAGTWQAKYIGRTSPLLEHCRFVSKHLRDAFIALHYTRL